MYKRIIRRYFRKRKVLNFQFFSWRFHNIRRSWRRCCCNFTVLKRINRWRFTSVNKWEFLAFRRNKEGAWKKKILFSWRNVKKCFCFAQCRRKWYKSKSLEWNGSNLESARKIGLQLYVNSRYTLKSNKNKPDNSLNLI
jgi:hypothetical protein